MAVSSQVQVLRCHLIDSTVVDISLHLFSDSSEDGYGMCSKASNVSDMNESNEVSKDSEDDWGVVDSEILPYQDEPLAAEDEALDVDDSEEERDVDGLTPSTLAERYERTVCLESWSVNSFSSNFHFILKDLQPNIQVWVKEKEKQA